MSKERAAAEVDITVPVGDAEVLRKLSGPSNENLKVVAELLEVRVGARGDALHLAGDAEQADLAARLFTQLCRVLRRKERVGASEVRYAVQMLKADPDYDLTRVFLDEIVEARGGKRIVPKGLGQKRYVDAIRAHDVVFGIGPAGTGKTFLAVALAVRALKADEAARIVLTRPAVEAGERLGFLPGDLEAKINPFLRPLYDALNDLLGVDEARELVERQVVEVAPLAFMRGRTLNDSFVILDEAQNTTREQMKMFLTRLGFGSKMVVSGDLTQTDLPSGQRSGLADAVRVLEGTDGVGVVRLTDEDVVRHGLVQRIVRAYDADGARRAEQKGGRR